MEHAENIENMSLEAFNVFPAIMVDSLDEINEQINAPDLTDNDFVVGDYLRVYVGNNQTNVRMYEIKKCAEYLGTINTLEQFFEDDSMLMEDSPPSTPPSSPGPHSNAAVVSPGGGKRRSRRAIKGRKGKKTRKLQKNSKTRKKRKH